MGTVVELNGTGHLDDAYFVVKRLFHETSCEEASRISREGGNEHLADFARSVMDRRVNVAATDAELATGGQFSFPLPTFPENREDVQFLCSVCHGQVSLFVLKYIIVSQQHVYYSWVLTL
jgi:hypothetical protein